MACPDEAKISEFVARALTATVAARIEAHLADCDDCRNLVFALASSGDDRASEREPAQRIDRFEIIDVVGRGAMGVVYRARDPELDRTVAIKVLALNLASSDDIVRRFRVEARAVNKIKHPNVVDIQDFGTLPDGRPYYVMEYLAGESLGGYLTRVGFRYDPLAERFTRSV